MEEAKKNAEETKNAKNEKKKNEESKANLSKVGLNLLGRIQAPTVAGGSIGEILQHMVSQHHQGALVLLGSLALIVYDASKSGGGFLINYMHQKHLKSVYKELYNEYVGTNTAIASLAISIDYLNGYLNKQTSGDFLSFIKKADSSVQNALKMSLAIALFNDKDGKLVDKLNLSSDVREAIKKTKGSNLFQKSVLLHIFEHINLDNLKNFSNKELKELLTAFQRLEEEYTKYKADIEMEVKKHTVGTVISATNIASIDLVSMGLANPMFFEDKMNTYMEKLNSLLMSKYGIAARIAYNPLAKPYEPAVYIYFDAINGKGAEYLNTTGAVENLQQEIVEQLDSYIREDKDFKDLYYQINNSVSQYREEAKILGLENPSFDTVIQQKSIYEGLVKSFPYVESLIPDKYDKKDIAQALLAVGSYLTATDFQITLNDVNTLFSDYSMKELNLNKTILETSCKQFSAKQEIVTDILANLSALANSKNWKDVDGSPSLQSKQITSFFKTLNNMPANLMQVRENLLEKIIAKKENITFKDFLTMLFVSVREKILESKQIDTERLIVR